jgi:hypothetical protein
VKVANSHRMVPRPMCRAEYQVHSSTVPDKSRDAVTLHDEQPPTLGVNPQRVACVGTSAAARRCLQIVDHAEAVGHDARPS